SCTSSGSVSAYLYLGGASGLASTPATTLTSVATVGGQGAGMESPLASAGDVNGDGYADVIVGDPGSDRAYLFLGSASGLATKPAETLASPIAGVQFGATVANAGDVNADGFADVIIGVSDNDGTSPGRAYVFTGSSSGLGTTPASTLTVAKGNGGFG